MNLKAGDGLENGECRRSGRGDGEEGVSIVSRGRGRGGGGRAEVEQTGADGVEKAGFGGIGRVTWVCGCGMVCMACTLY